MKFFQVQLRLNNNKKQEEYDYTHWELVRFASKYNVRGIASKLLSTAMVNCQTEYIYGTIREDNVASLGLVKKLGWQFIRKDWHRDHNVITVAKRLLM